MPGWPGPPVASTIVAPASIHLRRAQVFLLLVAVATTLATTPLGIVLLVGGGSYVVAIVCGVLVLAFCAASVVGYVLVSMSLRRSASLVDSQNEFLSAVSHELRTPMTAMRMFLDALLDDRLTDGVERTTCLVSLRREVLRLDDLVGRLIELSRAQAGPRRAAFTDVAVAEIVDAALQSFAATRLGVEANVIVDVQPNLSVQGDRIALVQVFVNLLWNAWKHGGESPCIRFVAKAVENRIVCEVIDNGPGIPAADRRRVFGMFERGASAVRAGTAGSGLGLAIVQAIVARHRGRIELADNPGGGSCFRVILRGRRAPPAEGA